MRLVQGMYGKGSKLFGLCEGQMRADDHVHNGRWYNSQGERIGWGDLSKADLRNIAVMLQEGEEFYILRESDTSWGMPKELNPEAPGMEFISSKAVYTIKPGKIVVTVSPYSDYPSFGARWLEHYGDNFQGVDIEFKHSEQAH